MVKIVSIFMLLVGKVILDNVAIIGPQKNVCNFVENIESLRISTESLLEDI